MKAKLNPLTFKRDAEAGEERAQASDGADDAREREKSCRSRPFLNRWGFNESLESLMSEAPRCTMLFANASFSESDSYVLVTTDTEVAVPITQYDAMRALLLKYPQIVTEVERINAIA